MAKIMIVDVARKARDFYGPEAAHAMARLGWGDSDLRFVADLDGGGQITFRRGATVAYVACRLIERKELGDRDPCGVGVDQVGLVVELNGSHSLWLHVWEGDSATGANAEDTADSLVETLRQLGVQQ